MGFIDVNTVSYSLADGRPLLDEVSFRVGEGTTSALIGANGAGKSTLLRIIRGELKADSGAISIDGGLGIMDQFVGHVRDTSTVRDLLISVAPTAVKKAVLALDAGAGRNARVRQQHATRCALAEDHAVHQRLPDPAPCAVKPGFHRGCFSSGQG